MSSIHLLEQDVRKEGVTVAAWQFEDAILDRLAASYPSDKNARVLHFHAAEADIDFRYALIVMLALAVFETPSWCDTSSKFFQYMDPEERCIVDGASAAEKGVFLSDLPYLAPGVGLIVEVFCVLVVARKLLLDRKLQNWYFKPLRVEYRSMKVIDFGLGMVVFALLDCLCFAFLRPRFRLAFIARTGFLVLLPQVRSLFSCILAVINELYSIASFLLGTMAFFGWIAVTIFDDLNSYVPMLTTEEKKVKVNEGIDTVSNTFYTMFVAGTTDEFTDSFLPSYTMYRASGLLWLFYLMIVHVLLLNLVLDTLVASYTEHSEETEESIVMAKTKGILKAFETLTEATEEGNEVSKATFLEFIQEFCSSPYMRTIPPDTAEIVFAAVDKDSGGTVDKKEFFSICGVIEYNFWTTTIDSPVKDLFPRFWESSSFKWFRKCVEDGKFDTFMNYVLLLNLVLVVIESTYQMEGQEESMWMENLELIFSFVYVSEVGLILSVRSWGYYWSQRSNQFDFVTTWLLLGSSILDEVFANMSSSSKRGGASVKTYVNVLRLLRLLRVIKQLKQLKSVQFMAQTISTLVLAAKDIFALLGVVMFFFSSLGVQLWGGLLYESNDKLKGTEYLEKKLCVLNFNDFMSSFGVWVVSLLCEYVPSFPEAIWCVSPCRLTWWVFPVFYVCGVTIVFELVKAFTIEVFLDLNKKRQEPAKEEFECLTNVIKEFESKGFALHYRAVGTDAELHEKMMEVLEEIEKESESSEGSEKSDAEDHGSEHHTGHE